MLQIERRRYPKLTLPGKLHPRRSDSLPTRLRGRRSHRPRTLATMDWHPSSKNEQVPCGQSSLDNRGAVLWVEWYRRLREREAKCQGDGGAADAKIAWRDLARTHLFCPRHPCHLVCSECETSSASNASMTATVGSDATTTTSDPSSTQPLRYRPPPPFEKPRAMANDGGDNSNNSNGPPSSPPPVPRLSLESAHLDASHPGWSSDDDELSAPCHDIDSLAALMGQLSSRSTSSESTPIRWPGGRSPSQSDRWVDGVVIYIPDDDDDDMDTPPASIPAPRADTVKDGEPRRGSVPEALLRPVRALLHRRRSPRGSATAAPKTAKRRRSKSSPRKRFFAAFGRSASERSIEEQHRTCNKREPSPLTTTTTVTTPRGDSSQVGHKLPT